MKRTVLILLLTVLVSTSYGVLLNKKLNKAINNFVTPIGFCLLIALLQLLYYPAQLFNWPSIYIHIVSLIVFLFGIGYGIIHYKEIFKEYFNKRTIIIGVSFIIFIVVYYLCYIDIAASDSQMYLNYMSQNINIDHINMFKLWTGEYGQEWDTIYLFQGYYHLGSFLCFLANIDSYILGSSLHVANITIQIWVLGALYSVVSSMLIYNFVDYFKKKGLVRWLMLAFGLLYENFFYWRIALSFYGNTFRTILICALIFYLYRYFKEENNNLKYVCILINFAGLACSSSYLFISFEVMYALMVYMFTKKGKGTIAEMADFVLPIVIYACCYFAKEKSAIYGIVIAIFACLYYAFRKNNKVIKVTDKIETFLQKYAFKIFVLGMFLAFAIGGAIYYLFINPDYYYGYWHWFDNHPGYDMIKDFFFVYTDLPNNIVNVFRWLGLGILLFAKWEDEGMKYLKHLMITVWLVFLNPLVVIAVSALFASNVYYRAFDIVFNPLTEMLFILFVVEKIKFKFVKPVLAVFVIGICIYAHVGSFLSTQTGEYGFFLNRDVIPKCKITGATYNIIEQFSDEIKDKGYSNHDQAKIISHAEGLRTFEPQVYEVFTPRQDHDGRDIPSDELFAQARNHYPWNDYGDIDYSTACKLIDENEIDYAIVEYWQNPEYDEALKECGTQVGHNDTFVIYKFRHAK